MGGGFPQYSTSGSSSTPWPGATPPSGRDPQRRPRLPELARQSRARRWSTGCRTWPSAPSPGSTRPAGTSPATATTSSSAASSRGSTASPAGSGPLRPAADRARAGEGPRFVGTRSCPTLVPTSTTSLRVSWPAGCDRDDRTLTYRVIRNGRGDPGAPVDANSQLVEPAAARLRRHRADAGRDVPLPDRRQRPGGNTCHGSTGVGHHADDLRRSDRLRAARCAPTARGSTGR